MKTLSHIFCIVLLAMFNTATAQISFSEVCSKNTNSLNVDGESPDWIELYNAGTSNLNLEGYSLSDDKDDPLQWTFPSISIPAGSYMLVIADSEDKLDDYAHTNFKISDGGEDLLLSNPAGELIDDVDVASLTEDITYSKIDGEWIRTYPSPGAANDGNELPQLSKPTFSHQTGIYTQNIQLTITAEGSNSRVEFYINDLKGLEKSETNDTTFNITTTMIICARADADDKEQSEFQCHTFVLGTDHELPVLSIIADQENLFDPTDGLFELGPNAEAEWPHLGANYWSDESEEVYFQYFNDGSSIFDGHGDLEMHGGRQARTNPQKTFKLLAKAKYNQEYFQYPFFSGQPFVETFKRLVVRNASGDYNVAHCRDGFIQDHVINNGLNIDGVAYEPVAVYINGSYYGLMGLREKIDEYYTQSHYSTQDIDLLEEEIVVVEGDSLIFKDHFTFVKENDLSLDANYETAATYFDVNSLIDYFHTEVTNSNADWPRNNIKFWRERKDGSKWRYFMFDLDAALGRFGWTEADDPMISAKLDTPEETSAFVTVMNAFLQNEGFKNQFFNRHQDLLNTTFSTATMTEAFDGLTNDMSSEMERHLQKWPTLSFEDWQDIELNKIRTYLIDRPNIAMDQMEAYFNLSGRYDLNITSTETNASFQLNSLNIIPEGFYGQYFNNIPIRVSPNTISGKQFQYWDIITDGQASTQDSEVIEMAFTADTELRAVYEGVATDDLVQAFRITNDGLHFDIQLKGNTPLQYEVLDIDGRKLVSGTKNYINSGLVSLDLSFVNNTAGIKVVHLIQGSRSYTAKILMAK